MKLDDRIIYVFEKNEFVIHNVEKHGNYFYVEFGQYTPCGEDWWETIWFDGTISNFIKAVINRYNNFDVDEEAEMWIERRGRNGVPSSIRALVEDAEWKESMLEQLADALEELGI